jgi:PST family polysaccharide transporter
MTDISDIQEETSTYDAVRSDTLSASLLLLVVAQVLQRSVGLGRNILFCGLLTDEQLGRWSLAFNFLMLAAPLVVLGLPGSFGRYVEHYRQRGQLRSFLLRTGGVTLLAMLGATALLLAYPRSIANFVYGNPEQVHLVHVLGFSLAAVIVFNFLVELFTAMRLVRFASSLQLVSSVGFAVVGVSLLYLTDYREIAIVLAYGTASLIAVVIGLWLLLRSWNSLSQSSTPLAHHTMWFKLLPFAGWIWATNLIGNLFEYADQFMLKHFSGLSASAADALIGQYYSSRMIPVLLIALATMVGNSLLPHLSRDWEAGRRDAVKGRLQLAVKLTALSFTLAAGIVLLAAPLLFAWALGGRYATGMSVMPGTLAYCVWFCLTGMAMSYLLCAEAAHLGSVALFCGLAANVGLNYLLAPRYGLPGVVSATIAANAVAFFFVVWLSRRRGMKWDRGLYWSAFLPLSLLLGGVPSIAIVTVVIFAAWQSNWIFNSEESGQLAECRNYLFEKLPWTWPVNRPGLKEA